MVRHDNMARHCYEVHGQHPVFMTEDIQPKWKPYHQNWRRRMLVPDPIWIERSESCSCSDDESSESEQSEDDEDNPAVDANSFGDGADVEEEEKLPEPVVDLSSPVYSDSSSHQE